MGSETSAGSDLRADGASRASSASRGGVRLWAGVGLLAQVVFVISWLVAALWQGPRYSLLDHSISDMYAVTAPHGVVLVVVLTLTGAAVILFAGLSLWPVLRGGGWPATAGLALLALSIFGLGDLLSPFEREACRQADAGCTAAAQIANSGGRLDGILSTAGVALFIAAFFFLAEAMQKVAGWQHLVWPARFAAIGMIGLFLATGLTGVVNLDGLFERLLAAFGAAAIAVLAVAVLRSEDIR